MKKTWLTALIIASHYAATAQVAAPPSSGAIQVRVHGGVPDSVIRYLSEIGVPTRVPVKIGDDARKEVVNKCGNDRAALLSEVDRLNGAVGKDMVVKADGELVLPACAFVQQDFRMRSPQPVLVGVLLRRETGHEGPNTRSAFYMANPALKNAESVDAGVEVVLPYRSRFSLIKLKPELGLSSAEALGVIRAQLTKEIGAKSAAAVKAGDAAAGAMLRTLSGKTLAEGGTTCRAPTGAPWPFDTKELLAVLERTTALAKSAQRRPIEARVAVMDSNFIEPPAQPFLWTRLATAQGAAPTDKYFYGIDAFKGDPKPLALDDIDDGDHGTLVATLALGGTEFIAADAQGLSKVTVRFASIVEPLAPSSVGGRRATRVYEPSVSTALDDALKHQAFIANMSFRFEKELGFIAPKIASNPLLLVIAAAGNDYRQVSAPERYPALYGGVTSNQVITVGASEAAGIADFSARGREDVDILAPGCDVPTLGFNLQSRLASGTSFAAPIVAFTSGLIRQFGVTEPARIKRRILAAADVRPDLEQHAWTAGVLNPAKALDLYVDRVDLDGAEPVVRGTIDWDSAASWRCRDGQQIGDLHSVWKVARLSTGQSDDWLVFWEAGQKNRKCRVDLSKEIVEFRGEDGFQRTLGFTKIRDLVPRHFK